MNQNLSVTIGGSPVTLFTDTGSKYTIIPPSAYTTEMGTVIAADTHLRAWGTKSNLDVKGMVNSTIKTEKGAETSSKIYIVDGFHPEPLLGDTDAENLGFIIFNKEGRDPPQITKTQRQSACESGHGRRNCRIHSQKRAAEGGRTY